MSGNRSDVTAAIAEVFGSYASRMKGSSSEKSSRRSELRRSTRVLDIVMLVPTKIAQVLCTLSIWHERQRRPLRLRELAADRAPEILSMGWSRANWGKYGELRKTA
jgi:hypothetical protein